MRGCKCNASCKPRGEPPHKSLIGDAVRTPNRQNTFKAIYSIHHQQLISRLDQNVSLLRIGLIARVGLSVLVGLRGPMRCADTG